MKRYDLIIIGAGIAGLYAAMRLPETMNVLVVCKDIPWECNTFYAQGGIVTALDEDDIPLHIADTIKAGSRHNDEKSVEIMSRESMGLREDLISMGMEFDRAEDGHLLYTREAAHSSSRILHAGGRRNRSRAQGVSASSPKRTPVLHNGRADRRREADGRISWNGYGVFEEQEVPSS